MFEYSGPNGTLYMAGAPWYIWGLGLLGIIVTLISERERISKFIGGIFAKFTPAPKPLPQVPLVPVQTDVVSHYTALKAHCRGCPAEVQAAFKIIWIHLEPDIANGISKKGGGS